MTAKSEQAVIDAFVEAVHVGDTSAAKRAGKRLVRRYFERGDWDNWDDARDGTLLRGDEIPSTPSERVSGVVGIEALEAFVSPARLNELQDDIIEGESLTRAELAVWQKLAAESILTRNPDCDAYASWAVRRVRHSEGRVAYLANLGGGYSFTESSMNYVCGTRTVDEARADLRTLGFIDVEDFRARWKPCGVE